eukprot:6459124-Amphidinium_carterae.2
MDAKTIKLAGMSKIPLEPKDPAGEKDAWSTATGRKDPRPKRQQKTPAGQKRCLEHSEGTQEPKTHWATQDPMGQKTPRAHKRRDARTRVEDDKNTDEEATPNRSHFTLALVAHTRSRNEVVSGEGKPRR